MKQVDDYLKRLSFWLSTAQRNRIVPEIRDALLDRLDVAAATTGRPLDDANVARELAAFGKPVSVAARYLRHKPVISGLLATFYWRVLVAALASVLVVQTVVVAVHANAWNGTYLAHATARLTFGLLVAFTTVTLAFVLIDRHLTADPRVDD